MMINIKQLAEDRRHGDEAGPDAHVTYQIEFKGFGKAL